MNYKELMINDMVKNLAILLMKQDDTLSIRNALDIVFNSGVFEALNNEKTALYYQSPRYVFSFLQDEINASNNNKQSVC